MKSTLLFTLAVAAAIATAVAWAAMIGLGVHRHAPPLVVSVAAAGAVLGPPVAAAVASRPPRALALIVVSLAWNLALLAALPVYFPGQRAEAVHTGLSLVGLGETPVANAVHAAMPDEPDVATDEVPVAEAEAEPDLAPLDLEPHEIALPVEGEGRRLSVPVVVEHAGREHEVWMLLDTGATYTTLPASLLAELGARVPPSAPTIRVNTAAGPRDTRLVVVDRVWLGDLAIDGVAISLCDECAAEDDVGLLGLNVTGGFNLTVDADRGEVVFAQRSEHDRRLDVMHFAHVRASLSRYPGGRVEVEARLDNEGPRPILAAAAAVSCRDSTWTIDFDAVSPGESVTNRRRLPPHAPCDEYTVALRRARW